MPRIESFLNDKRVRYERIPHPTAYTAQETAQRMHVHGWEMAKPVIVKTDESYLMVVVPAPALLNLDKVKELTGARNVELAREYEFERLFPDCEAGAMPPIGELYDIPVLVDRRLAEQNSIVFNAGTHDDAIRMTWDDFQRVTRPALADVTTVH